MKKFVFLFLLLLLSSCKATGNSSWNASPASIVKAVYLTEDQPLLSLADLRAHPEATVVRTFDELKKHASSKTALWIDRSATPFNVEQEEWINKAPQVFDPIVLVGYSDTLYSFRDLLKLCCFMGPATDAKPEPGFSVIQLEATSDPDTRTAIILQGYPQTPTVDAILEITNALLEGKIQPTSATTELPAATATNVP